MVISFNTNEMKIRLSIILSILFAAILVSCNDKTNEFGRIDQLDDGLAAPSPVTVTDVRSISGGCIIKVRIPDDKNIKGVVATYIRNGEEVNSKISRYVDTLRVEGFADTEEHTVEVCSFNVNEDKSEPVIVQFKPNIPAIRTVKPTIFASAGGVKIRIEGNTDKSDLAVCLLRDADMSDVDKSVSDTKWVEVTTLFTASDSIVLTRRGIEPVQAIFGVYVRDRWGNVSDTTKAVLTPLQEIQIPKKGFKYYDPGDDNCFSITSEASIYPVTGLWDGSGASTTYCFLAIGKCPIPCWLTIDLGVTVELSRIATLPRIGYNIWSDAHPRDFEFWGSMNPSGQKGSGEHGFDDTWFCLGKFRQFKPSGYNEDGSVGTITVEDRDYFNHGNDFELNNEEYPHAFDHLRYLRIVFVDTFSTFEMPDATEAAGVQFGEITPWGQVINK